ncbi:carotenoid 1,2-hydratase [Massilia sp. TS11]|uniref:lipocalin-like domain-containing protein n=1 Tax=Massilia sp. TS11 TaxID=2908003 RepID=UPI001EDC717F|nr:carotenoid 1,2-hydratase [Massilia sp. TS11]MCG2584616.1 carotenoid 1,2-hydratase [Massilia sp. TS11]
MRRLLCLLLLLASAAFAAPPAFTPVTPGKTLNFPADLGAHPSFKTEWWYATGWLSTASGAKLGFQITFFRSATGHDRANPSAFAPTQIIIGHAALADARRGKLLHVQRSTRAGLGLAWAREGDTDVGLDQWRLQRLPDGRYQASVRDAELSYDLIFSPTQPRLLQGQQGYSQKGPRPEHASYYYSEPQLRVSGSVVQGKTRETVSGDAWLDHEWSSTALDPKAAGWDWVGANLDDGSALMAFQIRALSGGKLWAHAVRRRADGRSEAYGPDQVSFTPSSTWTSPRTQARYPVATGLSLGKDSWQLRPLMPDQELDARRSTGAVYWEGAVRLEQNGKPAGHGYLEMTGYARQMQL